MLTILCWATFIALFRHGLDTLKDLNKVIDDTDVLTVGNGHWQCFAWDLKHFC